MRRRRSAALALFALTAPLSVLAAPAAQAADPVVLAAEDFEDGSFAPWTASGAPALAVVDDGSGTGNEALSITRAADYEGIQSPTGLLRPGVEHTFSMRARLPEGTAGSASIRFVVKPAYTWVANTTVDATGWKTVTGTYTLPAGADPAAVQVYLGTSDLTPAAPYTVLVDDLRLTAAGTGETPPPPPPWSPTPDPTFVPGGAVDPVVTPVAAARGTGNVSALTFDDGPNPGETERLLDFLAAQQIDATFCVIGQNITAAGGAAILRRIVAEGHTLCNHSTGYADMGGYTKAQVEADLKANLATIRTALGNPQQEVPYWRAPNGSWGQTREVAVALGMQPLAVVGTINDWATQDQATLEASLRTAMKPGQVVLAHDGGGDRTSTVAAVETVVTERLAAGWTFTLPAGGSAGGSTPPPGGGTSGLSTGFEDGLSGWGPRGDAQGDPTVAVTTTEAHSGSAAALVSDRTSQGDGIGHSTTGLLVPGTTYDISAWVKFAAGTTGGDLWLSAARTSAGATSYDTVGTFTGITSGAWKQVTATYQAPAADSSSLYFETAYPSGTSSSFLVDDIVVTPRTALEVQDLTPLKDTVPFAVGSAVDSRETTGSASQLLLRHFDQITAENHMKPEAWYDATGAFRMHPEAKTLMDYAQRNDLKVYGHTLVWHSQTPASFFTHADGTPLTTSAADQQLLRDRMRTHIDAVAQALSSGSYGPFGSATNPLVAFDVVNEVVSDGTSEADGLRRSEWYRILGESFIDDAFRFADAAFNGTYAVAGTSRPVTLTINDYNTEQTGKQARLHALVQRLLARGVPVDAVGHQFHVSLSFPVQALEAAIVAFADLPVKQVVSELDVTTGTPVTEAKLVDQGYYYRDAFRAFREHAAKIFSVTVWGLTDGRSWRSSSGAPLLFDDALRAKPAYYGAVDAALPAPQRAELVFRGSVPVDSAAPGSVEWSKLPLHRVDDSAGFQLRWEADHLTAYVEVTDATDGATDAVTFVVGDQTHRFSRNGTNTLAGAVTETAAGWRAVVRLPLTGVLGAQVPFDLRVTDGTSTTGWNAPGVLGTLTLVEPLSYTEVVQAPAAPAVDGVVDASWAGAKVLTTGRQLSGTGGATAEVRTMWRDDKLFVLAEVTDPTLDATGSDPWTQDSVEIFVDPGNVKNDSYRYDDTQIRISYLGVVSFGTGDEAFQRNRLTSAAKVVDGGYVVEASVSLLEDGGLGTFHGLDVQVNDATGGVRTASRTWADPTGLGYQSTARWGVARLVAGAVAPPPAQTATTLTYTGAARVVLPRRGTSSFTLRAQLASASADCLRGATVVFALDRNPVTGAAGRTVVAAGTTDRRGKVVADVRTTRWRQGSYLLTVEADAAPGCADASTTSRLAVR